MKTLQRSSRVLGGEPSRAVFRASTGLDLPWIRNQSFLTFLGFRNSQCKIKETKRGFYKMITVWVGFRSFEICARFSWLSPPHCLLPQIPPLMPFSISLYWIFSPLGKYFPEKVIHFHIGFQNGVALLIRKISSPFVGWAWIKPKGFWAFWSIFPSFYKMVCKYNFFFIKSGNKNNNNLLRIICLSGDSYILCIRDILLTFSYYNLWLKSCFQNMILQIVCISNCVQQ